MGLETILHLRQGTHIWGPERGILQLAEHLPAYGFLVEVVVLRRRVAGYGDPPFGAHPLVVQMREKGCQAEEWDAAWRAMPGLVRNLARQLRTGRYAVLHTHEYKTTLLGGIAARRARGVHWLATDHALFTADSLRKRLYRALEVMALRRAECVIVPSEFQKRRLLREGMPKERITVIPNGVDVASLRSQAADRRATRRALGVADGTPVLLTVGRLEPEKGHRYLLRALPRLLAAHPRLRLWLAGEGSLCEALRREAARLGLADAVDFLGYRADVPSLLAACDLLVVPSLEESFCRALLEAMALGRPVVAARVGGIPEVAVEGETAWLVPPADPEALAETIAEALARPEEAARRGEAGARRARECFQISAMVAGFAQVYQRVLASPV